MQADPNDHNDSDIVSLSVKRQAGADLTVQMVTSNSLPNVGDTVHLTIGVSNNGPDAATDAQLEVSLPTGLTYAGNSVS